jgi:hypothetical protein
MDDQNSLTGLAELLANNEESISEHYKIYSDKFGEHKNFWSELAEQEKNHALWIRDL